MGAPSPREEESNGIREYEIDHGAARADAYNPIFYLMAGLMVLGFICNSLVKPVAEKHYMSEEELAAERKRMHEAARR